MADNCISQFMLSVFHELKRKYPLGQSFRAKDVCAILPGYEKTRLYDTLVEDLTVKGFLRKEKISQRKKVFYVIPFQTQKPQFRCCKHAFSHVKKEYTNALQTKQNSGSLAAHFNYVSECTNGHSKNWLHYNICEILYNEGRVTQFYMGNKKMFKAKKENTTLLHSFIIWMVKNRYIIWYCEYIAVLCFIVAFNLKKNT